MSYMSPLLIAWLGLLLAVPAADAREIPESWPDWLKKEMRKENKRLRDKPLDVGEGRLTTRLPGKRLAGPDAFEGGWLIATDIGSDTAMECWLMEESQDLAALAVRVANLNIANSADANGPEAARSVWAVDAGNVGNRPWLALEWLYTVGEEPNTRVGFVKVRTTQIGDMSMVCSHNALGYVDTFGRAFHTIIAKADAAPVAMPSFYDELFLVSIGEQTVGVISNSFALDGEGDTRNVVVESMLMPVDASTVSTSDSYATTWTRPDGSMISAYEATAENGTLTSQLALEQSGDGGWRVSGVVQGKEIETTVSGDGPPMSGIQQMQIARDLRENAEADEASLALWVPDADPTRILPSALRLDRERGDGHGSLQMGPVTMATQFDEHGAMRNATMQLGATSMVITRVWLRGTPP